jgi:hypothetical protein
VWKSWQRDIAENCGFGSKLDLIDVIQLNGLGAALEAFARKIPEF